MVANMYASNMLADVEYSTKHPIEGQTKPPILFELPSAVWEGVIVSALAHGPAVARATN